MIYCPTATRNVPIDIYNKICHGDQSLNEENYKLFIATTENLFLISHEETKKLKNV